MGLLGSIGKAIASVLSKIPGLVANGAINEGVLSKVCRIPEIAQAILANPRAFKTSTDIRNRASELATKYLPRNGDTVLRNLAMSMAIKQVIAQVAEPARSLPAFRQLIQEQQKIDELFKNLLGRR